MLDFTRSDTERQCPKSAMCGSVAVTANDCHSWLRVAELWANHMHNAALIVLHIIEWDAEFVTVPAQLGKLFGCHAVV
jgi:hypothetical protein